MMSLPRHPNTELLLEAWQRLDDPSLEKAVSPLTHNHPDLLDALFVIERNHDGLWVFRNAGRALEACIGRSLSEHDFVPLWTGYDKDMITAFLGSVLQNRLPGIIQASGETLNGQSIDIELSFTPIGRNMLKGQKADRLLGLYQVIGTEAALRGRPIWRHRLTALHPPVARDGQPYLKLVANNN
ncbi:MAG: PAS domain-containing protein [Pseudomonadota bacterium]